jgi:hypothetical protein
MHIHYYKKDDYLKALEGAKKIVAQKFAIAEARMAATQAAGECISDEIYEEFLTWQLLSILVRNQETFFDPDDVEENDDK